MCNGVTFKDCCLPHTASSGAPVCPLEASSSRSPWSVLQYTLCKSWSAAEPRTNKSYWQWWSGTFNHQMSRCTSVNTYVNNPALCSPLQSPACYQPPAEAQTAGWLWNAPQRPQNAPRWSAGSTAVVGRWDQRDAGPQQAGPVWHHSPEKKITILSEMVCKTEKHDHVDKRFSLIRLRLYSLWWTIPSSSSGADCASRAVTAGRGNRYGLWTASAWRATCTAQSSPRLPGRAAAVEEKGESKMLIYGLRWFYINVWNQAFLNALS